MSTRASVGRNASNSFSRSRRGARGKRRGNAARRRSSRASDEGACADERPGIGRQPVQHRLDDAVALRARRPRGVGIRDVLLPSASQREAQPRVVGDVVVAHRRPCRARRSPRSRSGGGSPCSRRGRSRCASRCAPIERAHAREQQVVAALVRARSARRDQDQRLGIVDEPLAAAVGPLQARPAARSSRSRFSSASPSSQTRSDSSARTCMK